MKEYTFLIPFLVLIIVSVAVSFWIFGKLSDTTSEETMPEVSEVVSLISHWAFGEGLGQVLGDTVGGHSGQLGSSSNIDTNDPTWLQLSEDMGALEFDGIDDYVQTSSDILRTANNFTILVWFKADSTDFAHHILWQGEDTGNGFGGRPIDDAQGKWDQEMHLSLGDFSRERVNGKLTFFLGRNNNISGALHIATDFNDTANQKFVAIVVSNLDSSPVVQLFVNGDLAATDTGTVDEIPRVRWNTHLRFGGPGVNERFFDGTLYDVQIYNETLSPDQIYSLYTKETVF